MKGFLEKGRIGCGRDDCTSCSKHATSNLTTEMKQAQLKARQLLWDAKLGRKLQPLSRFEKVQQSEKLLRMVHCTEEADQVKAFLVAGKKLLFSESAAEIAGVVALHFDESYIVNKENKYAWRRRAAKAFKRIAEEKLFQVTLLMVEQEKRKK